MEKLVVTRRENYTSGAAISGSTLKSKKSILYVKNFGALPRVSDPH